MQEFDASYGRLNKAQKQAVDTIEGPVMVVAGPGTGKTQVLAMRVANILKKTQMRPGNILCLTFSVSGATAMRERLRELIGADAYGVTVSTIHGFCASVIAQYPIVFEQWAMKEQVSDIEKYSILNTIIDQVSAHSKLINQKDPYARDSDILSRIGEIKREGKSTDDLHAAARAYDEAMKIKSKPGTKAHEKNLLSARKFHDFVDIFERYTTALQEKGRYDYDDMILTVLKVLQEEDWILQGLQERYQYILVDEVQDTNGAQWAVINRLSTYDTLPHDPNLFVVGDDDQAIYRFQGANLRNMLTFHERFPKAPVIPLTISYRSTQPILDAAANLIAKNDERLVGRIKGLEKDLTAATKEKGETPQLLRAPSDTAEPWLIADLVEERLKEGLPAEEIAILTQKNAELFPLYDVFRARGIPVILHGKANLLEHPLVADALAILRALVHLQSDGKMIAALSCESFGCHSADLSRLALAAREKKMKISEILSHLEKSDLDLLHKDRLIAARDILFDLSHGTERRTVLDTVERALRAVAGEADQKDPLALAAIESFFQFAKQECLRKANLQFHGFLKTLEFYADPQYGQATLTYELPHLVTEGVQLMTAHQSKGLEFHTVILSNFRDGHWDNRRTPSGVSVPEDILYSWDSDQKKFEKGQDERRVAFVAMTRAKRELIFTCPLEVSIGNKHRPISPSGFFAEAGVLPEQEAKLKNPEHASLFLFPQSRKLDEELQAYLRQRLETFSLSATSLSRFLRNPQEFLAVDLLGQPEEFDEATSRSLGYGSAVHWALQSWGVAMQKGESFDESKFLEAFGWYLAERTILTEKQREDLTAIAEEALPAYFGERLSEKSLLYGLEKKYTVELGDLRLNGKIDRIDLVSQNSGDVIVIDYKTGAPKTESMIRGGLEAGEISLGDDGSQFRQLVFYSLLLEKADPLITPVRFALEYIGERGEDPKRVEFAVNDQEKAALRSLIKQVWEKIQELDFTSIALPAAVPAGLESAIKEQKSRSKKTASKKEKSVKHSLF